MAFLSPGNAFAQPTDFSNLLNSAPRLGTSQILSQVPVANAKMGADIVREAFAHESLKGREQQRFDNELKLAKEREDAAKKAAAIQLLAGTGSSLGGLGGGTRMAGDQMLALLNPPNLAQDVNELNQFYDQTGALMRGVGVTDFSTSGRFAANALPGMG
jgi:hypothetical protein